MGDTLTATRSVGDLTVDLSGLSGSSGAPQVVVSANKTLALTDANTHQYAAASYTVTIPTNAAVALSIGTMVAFVFDAASGALTIAPDTGVELLIAGSGVSASRTLSARGMCTALKVAANKWYIMGAELA